MIKYVRFFPRPRIVLVNMDGRRFQNEAAPPAPGSPTGPLENQPQHKAYTIFDSLTAEKWERNFWRAVRATPACIGAWCPGGS